VRLAIQVAVAVIVAVIAFQIGEEITYREWVHWLLALVGLIVGWVLGRELADHA
jgi:hypothetical protein